MPFDIGPQPYGLGARRLLELADFLERNVIDYRERRGAMRYYHDTWCLTKDECQTTACAMGWAGEAKMFGLTFNATEEEFFLNGQPIDALAAAMKVFEIDGPTALYLFAGNPRPEHLPDSLHYFAETRDQVISVLREVAAYELLAVRA